MIVDPFTNQGGRGFSDRLVKTYSGGYFDLRPTAESKMRKLEADKHRKRKVDPDGESENMTKDNGEEQ